MTNILYVDGFLLSKLFLEREYDKFKGSVIFQTENVNKYNIEGYRTHKYCFKMQKMKLFNSTLDKNQVITEHLNLICYIYDYNSRTRYLWNAY